MAVTHVVHWTYDLRPTLVLKELFLESAARGMGVGTEPMAAVRQQAQSIDAARIQWTVLAGNTAAERFYSHLGGAADAQWCNWVMHLG